MADKPQDATDEAQIRALIEQWSKAVREENRAAIRADHDADILMFDVPPPFLVAGSRRVHGDLGHVLRIG